MIKILQIGQKYNEWEVIEFVNNKFVTCKCSCGTIKNVRIHDLVNNKSKRCVSCANKLRGIKTHGQSNTRLFRIWKDMKGRCYCKTNHDYINYGGRGISICKKWLDDFMNFYEWSMNNNYKDNLTIERLDVNGNYEPSNCMWVPKAIQASNTRRNHYVYYNNKKYTIAELARKYKLPYSVVYKRLARGWSIDETINIKINERIKNYREYINKIS